MSTDRHRHLVLLWAPVLLVCAGTGVATGGGFDRAIEAASTRVVKLYGLGAGRQEGYGTGVIVSEDGLVITVLSMLIDASVVRAIAHDGTRYEADVILRDCSRQLALLRLKPAARAGEDVEDGVEAFPFFDLAQNTQVQLRPGDWVLAAGNSFKVADGSEPVSIAHGVFSGRTRLDARRRVRDYPYHGEVLVIDAITSNPGTPGSALVNLDGELVGMIGRVVISSLTHTHFNYAMPREVLSDFLAATLLPDEARRTGVPGESLADVAESLDSSGLRSAAPVDLGIRLARTGYRKVLPFVERVVRDSAAARAGVRKDDLILSVNGKPVPDVDAYDRWVKTLSPHEPIELLLRRGRAILTVQIDAQAGLD